MLIIEYLCEFYQRTSVEYVKEGNMPGRNQTGCQWGYKTMSEYQELYPFKLSYEIYYLTVSKHDFFYLIRDN